MAVIPLNAGDPIPADLMSRAADLPRGAPLIVMIHGYRYCPASPPHDPHLGILAPRSAPVQGGGRLRSWPQSLGLSDRGAEGLGLTFGWPARGTLGQVYRRAAGIGEALARSLDLISAAACRPVHLIGHSLGARVALRALEVAQPGTIGRLILMAAAELRPEAERAVASPAGAQAEIINVTSRENDIFDFMLEVTVGRGRRPALGFGLSQPRHNWLDLQIDAAETRAALASLGFGIGADVVRACHWSPYLREGMFDFYRVAMGQPWALPLPLLRAHLPVRQARRWSRLLQVPGRGGGSQSSFSSA